MIILALDPARRLGWALGEAGTSPATGVLKLRDRDERAEQGVESFSLWLHELIRREQVGLLVIEAYLPAGALKGATTSDTRDGAIMLNAAARAVAVINRVPFRSVPAITVRSHFIGRPSMGSREETKRAVVKMARQLRYISADCDDDDVADACALFDFSSNHFGRKAAQFALT